MALELDPRLDKLLRKRGVDEQVFAYLKTKQIVTICKFAGLADTKADVGEGICTPAGLDASDRPLCQP
eukprot:8321861-Pyramimonas_sp.AAC.1